MALALLGSFVIPRNYTDKAAPQVQSLFWPASAPVRSVARRLHSALGDDAVHRKQNVEDARLEVESLRAEVAYLKTQLEAERQRNLNISRLPPALRELCAPVSVVGGDPGTRDSLAIAGGLPDAVRGGMFVLYPGGVVGQLSKVGAAGGQVRLVTDPGFRVRAGFSGLRPTKDGKPESGPIDTPTVLVEGIGKNTLRINQGLTMDDVANAKIAPGDWVIVRDRDWPSVLSGMRIADVVKVSPRPDAPLFAEVILQPSTNLMLLDEVMVVVK